MPKGYEDAKVTTRVKTSQETFKHRHYYKSGNYKPYSDLTEGKAIDPHKTKRNVSKKNIVVDLNASSLNRDEHILSDASIQKPSDGNSVPQGDSQTITSRMNQTITFAMSKQS